MEERRPEALGGGGGIWRVLRLAAFLAVVVIASAWWKVREVSADFSERSLSLGRQLESWRDPRAGTSLLQLNGQSLSITSVSSEQSVSQILDRFTQQCAQNSGGMNQQVEDLTARGKRLPEFLSGGKFGVFRAQNAEREGTAACFAREHGDGLPDLLRRIEQLIDSGDFAALGQLRYVFARHGADSPTTHVVTVTSASSLPLMQMFPEQGDAPGADLLDGVRPEAARRVLSAGLAGTKQQTILYESELPATAALQSYDSPLRARGFERGDLTPVRDTLPHAVAVYFKAEETFMLLAQNRAQGGSTVSAFRLADGGYVRMRR